MKKLLALIVAVLAITSIAEAVELSVTTGKVFIKRGADTSWVLFDSVFVVEPTDTIKQAAAEVVLMYGNGVKFLLKDGTKFLVKGDGKLDISLEKGQLFFDRTDSTELTIAAKWCTFLPKGTAAAVKISKAGNASVAVLKGKVQMKAPTGVTQTVAAGSFSSYNPKSSTFAPVKKLPPEAIASLEKWSGVKSSLSPIADATPKTETVPVAKVTPKTEIASVIKETQEPEVDPVAETNPEAGLAVETKSKSVAEATSEDAKSEDNIEADDSEKSDSTSTENKDVEEAKKKDSEKAKPVWEISAGVITIDDEMWTRIAVAVDVPIWRFGVCFDLELFLAPDGKISNRSWDFSDRSDAAQSILNKIRYIRFNKAGDPVFIKIGGLDNVTYAHGLIVDRFTNMLQYPGTKLFGAQFELTDLSPIGISLQAMIPDVMDFQRDGGIVTTRLGFRPLKKLDKKLLNRITFGGTFAGDFNQYAGARDWDYTLTGKSYDKDGDGIFDGDYWDNTFADDTATIISAKSHGQYDSSVVHKDQWAATAEHKTILLGGDFTIPIIRKKIINFDIYGEIGVAMDPEDEYPERTLKGWGLSAPGASLKVGPMWAQVEYRHKKNKFQHNYFGTYYLDERLTRGPVVIKDQTISDEAQNGVFGRLGFNINGFVVIDGQYQYMTGDGYRLDYNGDSVENTDQRVEFTASIGQKLVKIIPVVSKIEGFFAQKNILGNAFAKSIDTYYGYRIGAEIMKGAIITWETRYGWRYEGGKLVDDRVVSIGAGLSF